MQNNPIAINNARQMLDDTEQWMEKYRWEVCLYLEEKEEETLLSLMDKLMDNIFKTIEQYEKQQINLSRRG